ncbi:CBL-interacting serine/threonine-protein kinase 21 [Sarracenia purpurea var. burkii]
MGYVNRIGKYQLSRTIGEGTFAKVKLAINTENRQYVAIKIIDKRMVIDNNLMYQVQNEIRTMKLLHHPNIVRIHEVIGTKTKVYLVMEYVSGGQLSDKMSYVHRLNEKEARKHFQQLIEAVDYCHCRGVYHRDLKSQNLLLDSKGNLKVSDFGLSALRKHEHGDLLFTACGSPSYVAPELLKNKGYQGAAADVWSCGVILFELLAGYLPFDDRSLMNLYKKILRAEYTFPEWFTESQKKLITRILDPNPQTRITTPEIIEDKWFQTDYEPAVRIECHEDVNLDDVHAAFNSVKENVTEAKIPPSPSFINAFQLIAMSHDLDLSGLFEEKDNEKQKTKLGSKHTINKTIEKIEAAAKDVSLSVERMNNSKMKIHTTQKMTRCSRSCFNLSAEVIEVAPTHCVVEISKSAGELEPYREFCKSLSTMLTEESGVSPETQAPKEVIVNSKNIHQSECIRQKGDKDTKDLRGYSSS